MPIRYVDDVSESGETGSTETRGRVRYYGDDPTPQTLIASFLKPLNAIAVGLPEQLLMYSVAATSDKITFDQVHGATGPLTRLVGGDYEPQNKTERVAESAGQMFADNLGVLVPVYRGAQLASQAGRALNPSTAERIRAEFFKFVQDNPRGAAFLEQLSAASAGAFGGLAEEEGYGELGQFGAEAVGGVLPMVLGTITPTAMAVRAFRRFFSPKAFEDRARQQIAGNFASALDEQGEANLARSAEVFGRLRTQQQPSIAEATGEPSLLAHQRRLEANASGSTLNALVRRKEQLAAEIIEGGRFAPEITGNEPDLVMDAVASRLYTVRANVDAELEAVRTQQAALQNTIPRDSRVSSGAVLRERRVALRDGVKKDFNERATEIGLNNPAVAFPFAQLRVAVTNEFFNPKSPFAAPLKPEIAHIIRDFKSDFVTFEDLQAIRTTIGDEFVEAAMTGNRRMMRQLEGMKKVFDTYFDNVGPTGGAVSPEDWAKFRTDYKAEFLDRFERGVAFRVGQRSRQGDYRILDEMVAAEFLKTEQGAIDFMRLYADDGAALGSLRSAILDQARNAAVRDGNLDRRALDTFIKNNRSLDHFPAIKEELEGVSTAATALSNRESQLKQRGVMLDRMRLSQALNGDVTGFVSAALRDSRVASVVANTARREELQFALNATVWDVAIKQVRTEPGELPNPEALLGWMDTHERQLNRLIGERHLQNLRDIYSGLRIVERTPMPHGRSDAATPMEKIESGIGTGIPQLSSRYFAAESGRVGYRYIAVDAASRFFNRIAHNKQDALLFEALFDSRVARDLANMKKFKEIDPTVARRLNGWLFTIGYPNEAQNFMDREMRELLDESEAP